MPARRAASLGWRTGVRPRRGGRSSRAPNPALPREREPKAPDGADRQHRAAGASYQERVEERDAGDEADDRAGDVYAAAPDEERDRVHYPGEEADIDHRSGRAPSDAGRRVGERRE